MRFLLALALLLVAAYLQELGFLRPVEDGVLFLLRPVERGLTGARGYFVTRFLGRAQDSSVDSTQLEESLRRALVRAAQVAHLEEENVELRAALKLRERLGGNTLAAQVIGRIGEPMTKIFLLDRGEEDGVQVGAAVVISDGVLVGRVASVTGHTSTALLTTDHQSEIAARIENATKPTGVVVGQRGQGMRMEWIPRDVTIEKGELVVTAENSEMGNDTKGGKGIPDGLVIGQIRERVAPAGAAIFQAALLDPPFRADRINVVTVLAP